MISMPTSPHNPGGLTQGATRGAGAPQIFSPAFKMAKTRRRILHNNKTLRVTDLWKDGSVGRGRSKTIYIQPQATDTAVLIAFFNPAPFKRPLKNLLYIMKAMRDEKIPHFVAECVFFDREPEVPGAHLVLRSKSLMFYKENLLNLLEATVPQQYTKLVFMDGDIIFGAPDWIDQISQKLDTTDIIQPFSDACWLYPDNTRIRCKKNSYGFAMATKAMDETTPPNKYHPGFVWAMKRSIFKAIGGLYDKAIAGNGDVMFAFSLLNGMSPAYIDRYAPCVLDTWYEYNNKVKALKPSIGYLTMDVYHLFHGLGRNRQYNSRHEIIKKKLSQGWDKVITKNAQGLYEFKDPELSAALHQYFQDRAEDVPIEVAMLPPA